MRHEPKSGDQCTARGAAQVRRSCDANDVMRPSTLRLSMSETRRPPEEHQKHQREAHLTPPARQNWPLTTASGFLCAAAAILRHFLSSAKMCSQVNLFSSVPPVSCYACFVFAGLASPSLPACMNRPCIHPMKANANTTDVCVCVTVFVCICLRYTHA